MRFIYVIMVFVILALNSAGCTAPATGTPADTAVNEPAASTPKRTQEEVIIKASYEKPLSLKDKNTILLDGLLEGEEYIEVIVTGEIFDFEQVALSWDESKNELQEKETIKSIKKIANQTLVIKTYQPEGIPTEKLRWKSRTGKSYEYIITERSLGETDNSITKYDITSPEIT